MTPAITLPQTKQEIIDQANNPFEFKELLKMYSYGSSYAMNNIVDWLDERNYGDGNEMFATIHFKPYDLYISFEGIYSSYGNSEWERAYISRPYVHREIRFEAIDKGDNNND